MKFKYPFQKVVDIKHSERTQSEWMLSQALGVLQVEEGTLSELTGLRQRLEDEMTKTSVHSTKIVELQMAQDYLSYVNQQISFKLNDIEKARLEVNHQQDDLSGKVQDEKVWARAKEKALYQYQELSLKKEQQELDELATLRYISPQFN